MKRTTRKVLLITIFTLAFLLYLWIDELAIKQSGFLDFHYDLIKIVLHSCIAYKLAKFLIRKFRLNKKLNSVMPSKVFLMVFLLCNSYIICQYSARIINNRIVNRELRKELNSRTLKLGPAGWGFECDSLTYKEFKELTKYSSFVAIPKESTNLFVHDWYEFDFNVVVEFTLPKKFNLQKFYKGDTTILKNIREDYYLKRTFQEEDKRTYQEKILKLDTSLFKRYKYEVW